MQHNAHPYVMSYPVCVCVSVSVPVSVYVQILLPALRQQSQWGHLTQEDGPQRMGEVFEFLEVGLVFSLLLSAPLCVRCNQQSPFRVVPPLSRAWTVLLQVSGKPHKLLQQESSYVKSDPQSALRMTHLRI